MAIGSIRRSSTYWCLDGAGRLRNPETAASSYSTFFKLSRQKIGDAAHAMSPIGGVGINLAIQDAVATANILGPRLLEETPSEGELHAVQREGIFRLKSHSVAVIETSLHSPKATRPRRYETGG
jgi:hypothetical protein